MTRMRRLLDARRTEFNELSEAEKQRLRRAFAEGDTNFKARLDFKGIRIALGELGGWGHTREETQALNMVIRESVAVLGHVNFFDFVFQLVPKANERLQELRSPKLYAEFAALDTLGLGRLKDAVCLLAVERHARDGTFLDEETEDSFWRAFSSDFPNIFKNVQNMGDAVDFTGYQELVRTLEVRRAEFYNKAEKRAAVLSQLNLKLEARHFGELAYLRRLFCLQDTRNTGSVPAPRIWTCLQDCGVAYVCGEMFNRTQYLLERTELFRFANFLNIATSLREDERNMVKSLLQPHFYGLEVAAGGVGGESRAPVTMSANDVPALMVQVGMCMDCVCITRPAEDLAAIMRFCDKDCPDQLDHDSTVDVVSKIAQRARAAARQREDHVAQQVGFSLDQVLELRVAFAGMTCAGVIGVDEVRSFFKQLNPHVSPVDSEIEELMSRVARSGYEGEKLHESKASASLSLARAALNTSGIKPGSKAPSPPLTSSPPGSVSLGGIWSGGPPPLALPTTGAPRQSPTHSPLATPRQSPRPSHITAPANADGGAEEDWHEVSVSASAGGRNGPGVEQHISAPHMVQHTTALRASERTPTFLQFDGFLRLMAVLMME